MESPRKISRVKQIYQLQTKRKIKLKSVVYQTGKCNNKFTKEKPTLGKYRSNIFVSQLKLQPSMNSTKKKE